MRFRSTAVTVMLVVAAVGAAAAPAATHQAEGEAYSGAFVAFEATDAAVADYAVDGSVVVENVTVQSASETDAGIDADGPVDGVVRHRRVRRLEGDERPAVRLALRLLGRGWRGYRTDGSHGQQDCDCGASEPHVHPWSTSEHKFRG